MEQLMIEDVMFNGTQLRFDNPNCWTSDQVKDLFMKHFKSRPMAFNIKLMGIQSVLNKYTHRDYWDLTKK